MALTNTNGALSRITDGYISADTFIQQREIFADVMSQFDDSEFLTFLELTGRSEESVNNTFHHYESASLFRSQTVATGGAPGGAASGTLTLAASSHTTINSVNRSYAKVGDQLLTPSGVQALVTAKSTTTDNAHTLTLSRIGTTGSLITAFAAGVVFSVIGNAFAEGTSQPTEFTDAPPTRFTGQMQQYKAQYRITGDADSNKIEVTYGGKPFYWYKQQVEMVVKHRLAIAFSQLLGAGGNATDAAGLNVPFTKGLDSFVKDFGNNYVYGSVSGIDTADMDAIVAIIKAERGGSEYNWMTGYRLKLAADAFLRSQMGSGSVVYGSFNGLSQAQVVNLGFDSYKYGGISFHLKENDAFNHPQITATSGQIYPDLGLLIPGAKQTIQANVNGVKQTMSVPALQIRYKKSSDGKSRRYETWERDKKITNIDEFEMNVASQEGLQAMMLNKFIRTTIA